MDPREIAWRELAYPSFEDLNVGDQVVASINSQGDRFERGTVERITWRTCCVIRLPNNTYRDGIHPYNIRDCACASKEPGHEHTVGAKVCFLGNEGSYIDGYFLMKFDLKRYVVRLSDGPRDMSRDDMYGPSEQVPRSVVERIVADGA